MYLTIYLIEKRKKDENYAWITQCKIFKFNLDQSKFELFHQFLVEICNFY